MTPEIENAPRDRVPDEALHRGFESAYSHLFRFGALANAGGIAACVGVLGAIPVAKFVLVPFAMFVCGILCIWLSLIVINQRLADAIGTRTDNSKRPYNEKIAEVLATPFDNGALIIAPFALFCLGIATGFFIVLVADPRL